MANIKSPVATAQPIILEIDQNDPNSVYLGKAKPGTASSATDWQIIKIGTAGGIISLLYASGTTAYDKVWDNRIGYSYS